MVEVNITYETLFDLLRREKSNNELQGLDISFYDDVRAYLTEKENTAKSTKTTSQAEVEKIRIQLKNAKKIIKELYEIREKKIILLAMNKVKTGSSLINTSNLLQNEEELFNEAYNLLKKYKDNFSQDMLKPLNKGETKEDKEINIMIKTELPKFMGADKKVYGPFEKGEQISLPKTIADLLVSKGRADNI